MINLPDDLVQFIQAEVRNGHFASEEAALAEAVRLLQKQIGQTNPPAFSGKEPLDEGTPDPLLGTFRDAAHDLDQIVLDAMTHREQQAWRLAAHE